MTIGRRGEMLPGRRPAVRRPPRRTRACTCRRRVVQRAPTRRGLLLPVESRELRRRDAALPSGATPAARGLAGQLPESAHGRQGHRQRPQGRHQLLRHRLVALRRRLFGSGLPLCRCRHEGLPGGAQHLADAFCDVLRDLEPRLRSRPRVHTCHVPDGAALRLRHGLVRKALLPQPFLPAHRRAPGRLLVPDRGPSPATWRA